MPHEKMSVEQWRRERGTIPHQPQQDPIKPSPPAIQRRSHGGRGYDGRAVTGAERKMAAELDLQHRQGLILYWSFQSVKLRLADLTWYTPDFFVIWADGRMEFREIKGRWEDDARIKFKVVAEIHLWATFTAWKLRRGAWECETAKAFPLTVRKPQ